MKPHEVKSPDEIVEACFDAALNAMATLQRDSGCNAAALKAILSLTGRFSLPVPSGNAVPWEAVQKERVAMLASMRQVVAERDAALLKAKARVRKARRGTA
jgi:hypothetical protein